MQKLNEVLEMLKEQPRLVNCVSPMTFGEISEAFRIMNQRLEAAEEARVDIAEGFRELEQNISAVCNDRDSWQQRAEEAESKIAEVEQQKAQWVEWAKEGCAEADRLKAKLQPPATAKHREVK